MVASQVDSCINGLKWLAGREIVPLLTNKGESWWCVDIREQNEKRLVEFNMRFTTLFLPLPFLVPSHAITWHRKAKA